MKHLIVFFLLTGFSASLWAQDVIIRKDGSEMQAKVLEVTPDQIKYQRLDNPDGPVYSEKKSLILKIKYANGSEDIFVKESASPTVQDQVVWQSAAPAKKPRKVRYSGLVEVSPYLGVLDWGLEYDRYDVQAYGVCIATTHGVQLFDKYFLGGGVGLNIESNHLYVPVYFNFRLDFSHKPARPFMSVSLGMQFGSYYDDLYGSETYMSYGLWSNILFGYRFKSKWYIAGGLTLQSAVYDYPYESWSYGNSRSWQEGIYGTVGAIASVGIKF